MALTSAMALRSAMALKSDRVSRRFVFSFFEFVLLKRFYRFLVPFFMLFNSVTVTVKPGTSLQITVVVVEGQGTGVTLVDVTPHGFGVEKLDGSGSNVSKESTDPNKE
ncbi:hypothetical protein Hanom_Chr08g00692731 [Helianthus anomalus]